MLGIHGCAVANFLIALLGSGDDWLVVSNDDVDGPATFDGGLGADQYSDFGGNTFARAIRTSI